MSSPIKIAISSCLLGEKVRYDGASKPVFYLNEIPAELITWVPICPEADAGLGIPRPPMNLYQLKTSLHALTRDGHHEKTAPLVEYTEKRIPDLLYNGVSGVILKSKSPSCGIGTTPIYDLDEKQIDTRSGLFAQAILDHPASLPAMDEHGISDPTQRRRFFSTVYLRKHVKNFFQYYEDMNEDLMLLQSVFILKSNQDFLRYFEWMLLPTEQLMEGIVSK